MGLRCLLGHDFGDPEIERERREDGNEMVVTVREVRACDRCGERQVLSENKEVTTIRTPGELGLDADVPTGAVPTGETFDGDASSTGDVAAVDAEDAASPTAAEGPAGTPEGPAGTPEPDASNGEVDDDAAEATSAGEDTVGDPDGPTAQSAAEDDGVILDDDAPPRKRGEWPDPDGDREDPEPGAEPTGLRGAAETATREEIERGEFASEEVTDDAELIDADEERGATRGGTVADDADGGPAGGQVPWPEHEDPGVPERESSAPTEWPEPEGEDEGFAAESVDDDVEVSLGGNELTPEVNGRGTDDETDTGERFVRAGDAPTAERRSPGESAGAVFYCPNCSFQAAVGQSSVRAGDICPACHRGYLAERDEE